MRNGPVFRRHQGLDGLPDQFRGRVPEQLLQLAVDGNDVSAGIGNQHRVRRKAQEEVHFAGQVGHCEHWFISC